MGVCFRQAAGHSVSRYQAAFRGADASPDEDFAPHTGGWKDRPAQFCLLYPGLKLSGWLNSYFSCNKLFWKIFLAFFLRMILDS